MSRTLIGAAGRKASLPVALGPAVRALTLVGATLTTGLVTGVFYAYAVSVNPGLALQPDAGYVSAMQAINREIQNPVFFLSFFGAVLTLLSALYVGGGFLLTVFINVPMNEELAGVAANTSPGEQAGARAAYEDPWNFWNGARTVFSSLAFLALIGACLLREERGPHPEGRPR